MNTHTQSAHQFIEMPTESSNPALQLGMGADDEVARSENNILRWMEYLPEDCIRTMIEMGWDVST